MIGKREGTITENILTLRQIPKVSTPKNLAHDGCQGIGKSDREIWIDVSHRQRAQYLKLLKSEVGSTAWAAAHLIASLLNYF